MRCLERTRLDLRLGQKALVMDEEAEEELLVGRALEPSKAEKREGASDAR